MVRSRVCLLFVLLFMVAMAEGAPKPKKVKCKDKKYTTCYHKVLYCPTSCPRKCVVDCTTCQPVCPPPPPPPPPPPSPPPPRRRWQRRSPPPPIPSTPPPIPSTPPPSYSPPPPPPPSASTPPSSSPPPPSASTPPSSSPPPLPPTVTPAPPSLYPPPPPSSEASGAKRVRCRNRNYPTCYGLELTCPSSCPDQCEVDCVTCSPFCNCNRPGAVCQDPRFIGGDGITFYFHGKKDEDFCLVSDSNLHINAHFIGKRNPDMKRDFTWVQSLGLLFHNHKLFIGAKSTSTWDDAVDRLSLAFNEEPIFLPIGQDATWQHPTSIITISRIRDTNAVEIHVKDNFKIKATVVPITQKESAIHKYGITQEDCFAHLDLSFKFYALSEYVHGVLGQTYAQNYVSRVKMGVAMPVLGGDKEFATSSLFAADCEVARFNGEFANKDNSSLNLQKLEFMNMNCDSGIDGTGVVCKR